MLSTNLIQYIWRRCVEIDTSLFLCKVLAIILLKIAGKKYLSGQSEKLKHLEHSLEESEILSCFRVFPTTALDAQIYSFATNRKVLHFYFREDKSGFLTFGRVARSIQTHYLDIINFFERRATNAAAESFNAKIKAFRAQFRGVRDRAFFLYRLAKLYA